MQKTFQINYELPDNYQKTTKKKQFFPKEYTNFHLICLVRRAPLILSFLKEENVSHCSNKKPP